MIFRRLAAASSGALIVLASAILASSGHAQARLSLVELNDKIGALELQVGAIAAGGGVEINQAVVDAAGGFPFVISASGSYRLTGNLVVPDENTTAIRINAGVSDVHIDLNQFTIRGSVVCSATTGSCSATGTGHGIQSLSNGNGENIAVSNGTVRGMGGDGFSSSSNTNQRIVELRVISNGGVGINVGSSSTIRNVHASRNGGAGIKVGPHSLIQSSVSGGNGGDGIQASSGATIQDNTSSTNGGLGLNTFFSADAGYGGNVFTCNDSAGACTNGIQVSGGKQIGSNVCGTDTTCP